MPEFKKGDRVKVVLEGVVDEASHSNKVRVTTRGAGFKSDESFTWVGQFDPNASVEKVEPPVEVFKSGDVVRHKEGSGWLYALTSDGGYTDLSTGNHWPDGEPFTSRHFEKVELPK